MQPYSTLQYANKSPNAHPIKRASDHPSRRHLPSRISSRGQAPTFLGILYCAVRQLHHPLTVQYVNEILLCFFFFLYLPSFLPRISIPARAPLCQINEGHPSCCFPFMAPSPRCQISRCCWREASEEEEVPFAHSCHLPNPAKILYNKVLHSLTARSLAPTVPHLLAHPRLSAYTGSDPYCTILYCTITVLYCTVLGRRRERGCWMAENVPGSPPRPGTVLHALLYPAGMRLDHRHRKGLPKSFFLTDLLSIPHF